MFQNGNQIDYQPALITDSNNKIIGYQQICISRNLSYNDDTNSGDSSNDQTSDNILNKIYNIIVNTLNNDNGQDKSPNELFWQKGLLNKGNLIRKNNNEKSQLVNISLFF